MFHFSRVSQIECRVSDGGFSPETLFFRYAGTESRASVGGFAVCPFLRTSRVSRTERPRPRRGGGSKGEGHRERENPGRSSGFSLSTASPRQIIGFADFLLVSFLSESFFLHRKKDGEKTASISEKQYLIASCDTCLEKSKN